MIQEVLADAKERMSKAIETFKRELGSVRTGRANTSLLDGVRVDYYGSQMPLNQLATVNAPEATLLTVQPWDAGALALIEKALQASDLGLNPQNDGRIIRIPLPPLTEERRRDLVKVIKNYAEESRVAIRNIRRDANDMIKALEKEKDISQDESESAQKEVQKLTDAHTDKIGDLLKHKEDEIIKV